MRASDNESLVVFDKYYWFLASSNYSAKIQPTSDLQFIKLLDFRLLEDKSMHTFTSRALFLR